MEEYKLFFYNNDTEEKQSEVVLARNEEDAKNKVRNKYDKLDIFISIDEALQVYS